MSKGIGHRWAVATLWLGTAMALSGCVVAAVAGVGAGTYLAVQNRSPGQVADDAAIRLGINDRLVKTPGPLFDAVSVEVIKGRVLLVGRVPSDADKRQAEDIAKAVPGVVAVDNQLTVAAPSGVFDDLSDAWLTGKVKSALWSEEDLSAAVIGVETVDGVVYLSGVVKTAAERDLAVTAARRVSGVARVVSAVQIDQAP